MTEDRIACVDIGSTWTKAVLVRPAGETFQIEARASTPTTTDHLPDGFYAALEQVAPGLDWRCAKEPPAPVLFSSSAKGGLNVAVVGLVPEMTLEIGRLAACSAGARIFASFPYRLTRDDVVALERAAPDILLLSGGTDGGNERYAIENAGALAASSFAGTVVYAGNAQARDRVREILRDRDLRVTENLMPDFGRLNIEPARETIRAVFLERIVSGKGLDGLVRRFGHAPVPTPRAVLDLVQAIGEHVPGWESFALVDAGGATTDCYSHGEAFDPEAGAVLRGITEPTLKRTVEGDLGMRVSARSALEAARDQVLPTAGLAAEELGALEAYVERLVEDPGHLAETPREEGFDRLLLQGCVHHALLRHVGSVKQTYTTRGPVWVQTGKDLRRVRQVVGTGGALAALGRRGEAVALPASPPVGADELPLLPERCEYLADPEYLFPLLGNLAAEYPSRSAATAVSRLSRIDREAREREP